MTGYVRKDTTNNIADGNVINAADLDAEFDGVQDAFNASTGHKHDGTAGEGATINALGPTQDVTVSSTLLAPKTTNTVDIGSSSLKFKDLFLAGNGSVGGTLAVTGVATFTAQPILSSLTASRAVFSDGSKGLVSNAITGTGNVVMSASPTLTGTAGLENITASGTLGVTGVATFTAQPIVSSLTASRAVFSDGSKGLVSNAITGTGNVVMSASPTLTGTIAAEALTASSTVTLSGGTANGVAYLNGSKVLTSGSALTFDGVNLTQTGSSGTLAFNQTQNASGAIVNTKTATGSNSLGTYDQFATKDNTGTTNTWAVGVNVNSANSSWELYNGGTRYSITQTGTSIWSVGGSESMRLTSTGLGIGTSSPAAKLDVVGAIRSSVASGNSAININNSSLTGKSWDFIPNTSSGESDLLWYYGGTSAGTRMTLSNAGNLGLGSAPKPWGVGKAIDIGNSGSVFGDGINQGWYAGLTQNAYWAADTLWRYKVSGVTAGRYEIVDNLHKWFNSAAGTAGDAISFTQAMTLDASGQLAIGTTSIDEMLRVNGSSNATSRIRIQNQGTSIAFLGSALGISGAGNANDLMLSTGGATNLVFGINTSERARIDSSGNLLVGTQSTGSYADGKIVTDTSGTGASFKTSTVGAACLIGWNSATSGDNVFSIFVTETSPTVRGSITYNRTGGLTVYNTTSDYRAKDISGPVTNSGSLIDSVPVYMGKMKWAEQERPMFIAHEVPAYAHTGVKDAVDADGNPVYQQMDASALIPVMWAEIQSLRQRVAQLETN